MGIVIWHGVIRNHLSENLFPNSKPSPLLLTLQLLNPSPWQGVSNCRAQTILNQFISLTEIGTASPLTHYACNFLIFWICSFFTHRQPARHMQYHPNHISRTHPPFWMLKAAEPLHKHITRKQNYICDFAKTPRRRREESKRCMYATCELNVKVEMSGRCMEGGKVLQQTPWLRKNRDMIPRSWDSNQGIQRILGLLSGGSHRGSDVLGQGGI